MFFLCKKWIILFIHLRIKIIYNISKYKKLKTEDNMKKLCIGYAALTKASWKTPKISGLMESALKSLKKMDIELVNGEDLTTTESEALELCGKFKKNAVDAVILHLATFPVGAIIPAIAKSLNVPIILFANPEKPGPGGMWEQNSFCGANMAAHTLKKLGIPYHFAWDKSENAAEAVAPFIKILKCVKELSETRLGLVGGRVPGFYTSDFDEMKLRAKFGTAVEVIDLIEIVNTAKKLGENKVAAEKVRSSASAITKVSDTELSLAGNLYEAFMKTAEKYVLDGYAVRCWPELPDIYEIAPCAVIGMLNDSKLTVSCEGDILGAMTMQIQKELSDGLIPFFVDLISFDYKENTSVVWHCGAAPSSLCRDFSETSLCKHMRVDGGDKKGLTNEFSLKPGRVTLAKMDETSEGYRMLIASGTALETDKFIRGNPLNIKFDSSVKDLIDTIMKEGFEHHYSVIHADIKDELCSFCEFMNIDAIVVE